MINCTNVPSVDVPQALKDGHEPGYCQSLKTINTFMVATYMYVLYFCYFLEAIVLLGNKQYSKIEQFRRIGEVCTNSIE